MKKLFSIITVISMICLTFVGVSAQSVEKESKQDIENMVEYSETNDAVTALEPYVVRLDDGSFKLDAPIKVTKKIPADVLEQITSSMEITNNLVRDGSLVTTAGLDVFLSGDTQLTVISASVSGGVSKIVFRWYGWDLYLSHSLIDDLNNVSAGAGGIAVIIGLAIPASAVVLAVIAATVVIYLSVINIVDNGNGVLIKLFATGTPFYIASQ